MKPVIGIINAYAPLSSKYEFREVAKITPKTVKKAVHDHAAFILPLYGAQCKFLDYLGWKLLHEHGSRLGIWSLDSHNALWAAEEALAAKSAHTFFTAHSSFIPEIGENTKWIPCSYFSHCTGRLNEEADVPSSPLFDMVTVANSWNTEREEVLKHIHRILLSAGMSYMICRAGHGCVKRIYSTAVTVLNANQNIDLNIRQFEAFYAEKPVVMTPALDWMNPRFDDLRPYAVEIPRYPTLEQITDAVSKASKIDATPARAIVLEKHLTVHRYEEMADYLLA